MNYNKMIWKKKRGKDGKIYYYNVITRKTRQYLKGGFDPEKEDEEHEKLKKIMNRLIDLRCAISSTLILDPVSIGSRKENKPIVYERAAIQTWFDTTRRRGGQTLNCPSTRLEVDGVLTPETDRSREIALFVEEYKDVQFQGPSWDEIREDCAVYLTSIQGNNELLQIQNEAHIIDTRRREAEREELQREREREQERVERERLQREQERERERLVPDHYRLLCTIQEAPPRAMLVLPNRVPAFLECRELSEIGKDKVLTLLEYLEPFCPIVSIGYELTKKILLQYPNSKEFLSRLEDIWKNAHISEQQAYEQNKVLLDTVEKTYWKQRKTLSIERRQTIERLRELRILLEYPDIEDFCSSFTDVIADERLSRSPKKPRQLKLSNEFSDIFEQHFKMIVEFEQSKVPDSYFEIEIKRFWDYESERAKEKERKRLKSAASEEEKLQILKTLEELEDFWNRDDKREERLKERKIKARSFLDKSLNAYGFEICTYGLPRHAYIQSLRLSEETWKYKSVDEETIKRIKEVLILMKYSDKDKTFLEYAKIWEEVHKAEQARLNLFLQPQPIFQQELFTHLELAKQRAEEMSKKLLEHEQKLENERQLEKNKKIQEVVSGMLLRDDLLTNQELKAPTLRNDIDDLHIETGQGQPSNLPNLYNLEKLKARLVELESTASLDDRQARKDEEEKRKLRELIERAADKEPKVSTESCIGVDCDRPRLIRADKQSKLKTESCIGLDCHNLGTLPRPSPERRTYQEELERIRLIPDELSKKDAFERLEERRRQQAQILQQQRLQRQRLQQETLKETLREETLIRKTREKFEREEANRVRIRQEILRQRAAMERLEKEHLRIQEQRKPVRVTTESARIIVMRLRLHELIDRSQDRERSDYAKYQEMIQEERRNIDIAIRDEPPTVECYRIDPRELDIETHKQHVHNEAQRIFNEEIIARKNLIQKLTENQIEIELLFDSPEVQEVRRAVGRRERIELLARSIIPAEDELRREMAEPRPYTEWPNWWQGPRGSGVKWTAGGWMFVRGEWRVPSVGWRTKPNRGGVKFEHYAPTRPPPVEPGDWVWDDNSKSWKRWGEY
jgi:hypothetical protein